MARRYELRTYLDLQDAVREELSIPTSDTTLINRIKRDLNVIYMNEVVPFANWWWARGYVDLHQEPLISTGTVAATQDSKTITFSSAPADTQKGAQIQFEGETDIYTIDTHTGGSTTALLTAKYIGTTDAAATYKLWRRALALPTDCRETFEVHIDSIQQQIEGIDLQEFRKIENLAPSAEGKPCYYSTSDFVDPSAFSSVSGLPTSLTRSSVGLVKTIVFNATLRTDTSDSTTRLLDIGQHIQVSGSGDQTYNTDAIVSNVSTTNATDDTITYTAKLGLTESAASDTGISVKKKNTEMSEEVYRELLIYPSKSTVRALLHVDYIKRLEPMVEDTDEPKMPIEDRIVLLYGALSRSWVKQRNQEIANDNFTLFQNKLSRMKGKLQDSNDFAQLLPDKRYLATKRSAFRKWFYRDGSGLT